jgi:hypothetical protein
MGAPTAHGSLERKIVVALRNEQAPTGGRTEKMKGFARD